MGKMSFIDYYAVLNVKPGASLGDIKRAFHEMALLSHPDMAGENGAEDFMLIRKAYETLSGAGRREYDMKMLARLNVGVHRPVQHDLRFVSERIRKRKWWEDPLKSGWVDEMIKSLKRR